MSDDDAAFIEAGRALGYLPLKGQSRDGIVYRLASYQVNEIRSWIAAKTPSKTGYDLDAVEWRRP